MVDHAAPAELSLKALAVKTIDAEARTVRVLASDDSLDRDGERILPSAFKNHLAKYMENPVILAGHQHRSSDGTPTVIGRAVRVWIDKKGLWAIIEFARTDLGEQYWILYRDSVMKAVSIGFRTIQSELEFEGGKQVRVITEAELFEISCVAVPANPNAGVKSQKASRFIELRRATKDYFRLPWAERQKILLGIYARHKDPLDLYANRPKERAEAFSVVEEVAIRDEWVRIKKDWEDDYSVWPDEENETSGAEPERKRANFAALFG